MWADAPHSEDMQPRRGEGANRRDCGGWRAMLAGPSASPCRKRRPAQLPQPRVCELLQAAGDRRWPAARSPRAEWRQQRRVLAGRARRTRLRSEAAALRRKLPGLLWEGHRGRRGRRAHALAGGPPVQRLRSSARELHGPRHRGLVVPHGGELPGVFAALFGGRPEGELLALRELLPGRVHETVDGLLVADPRPHLAELRLLRRGRSVGELAQLNLQIVDLLDPVLADVARPLLKPHGLLAPLLLERRHVHHPGVTPRLPQARHVVLLEAPL
mmetsp:Transcript_107963/g.300158  ORF Transcript_107963/g.300158 Transcript_107963/m.300158 type:complete len:272 (-) Transcript_107963:249-1064(-)